MFILHTSNKTENLLAHLATVIASQPLASPFTSELFLVQSPGMERWLAQQLAVHFDVWANYRFLFPGKFFSEIAQCFDVSLNDQAFEREQIVWRIESLLRNTTNEQLKPLSQFINGENWRRSVRARNKKGGLLANGFHRKTLERVYFYYSRWI